MSSNVATLFTGGRAASFAASSRNALPKDWALTRSVRREFTCDRISSCVILCRGFGVNSVNNGSLAYELDESRGVGDGEIVESDIFGAGFDEGLADEGGDGGVSGDRDENADVGGGTAWRGTLGGGELGLCVDRREGGVVGHESYSIQRTQSLVVHPA